MMAIIYEGAERLADPLRVFAIVEQFPICLFAGSGKNKRFTRTMRIFVSAYGVFI